MSYDQLPPPPAPLCLVQPYKSSQKGGTLIASDVLSLASHLERIGSPDGYRPELCQKCQCDVLHVHDYRERKLAGDPLAAVIRIIRFICVRCRSVWRILPAFLARYLWRRWSVVEAHCLQDAAPRPSLPKVPERTIRRWKARLRSAMDLMIAPLKKIDDIQLRGLIRSMALNATREEFVSAHGALMNSPMGQVIAEVASRIHLHAPGVRVM